MSTVFLLGTCDVDQRPLKLCKDTYRYAAPGVASKPGRANSLRPKLVGPARLLH